MLCPSGDDELVRVGGGEHHGVADDIPPQSARCGYHHGVVPVLLHSPQRHHGGVVVAELVHGDELIEHPVVDHQRHGLVGRVVLQSEEALAGIVCFHVVHAGRGDELFVLLAVRRESHAAVEEHLQVGPHLLEMRLARYLHYPCQHGEHPRGHSADVRHVFPYRLPRYALALFLEVGEQGGGFLGHSHEVCQRVDVLDENCAEVAHERPRHVVVRRVASAQDEAFAVEDAALGVVAQIENHGVGPSGIVYVLEAVPAHGDELALVVGRARRLGVPFHLAPPQHVALSVAHPVDVRLQFLVCVHGHSGREVLIRPYGIEGVLPAVFRVACRIREICQGLHLQLLGVVGVAFYFLLP